MRGLSLRFSIGSEASDLVAKEDDEIVVWPVKTMPTSAPNSSTTSIASAGRV